MVVMVVMVVVIAVVAVVVVVVIKESTRIVSIGLGLIRGRNPIWDGGGHERRQ